MIATGSIGAAVLGLGACSMSADELTELLAGITGTEVVSLRPHSQNECYSPESPAEGGITPPQLQLYVLACFSGVLSPAPVWRGVGGVKDTCM